VALLSRLTGSYARRETSRNRLLFPHNVWVQARSPSPRHPWTNVALLVTALWSADESKDYRSAKSHAPGLIRATACTSSQKGAARTKKGSFPVPISMKCPSGFPRTPMGASAFPRGQQ